MSHTGKRHFSLIPISHEHREILSFCLKIRKGIQKGINPDSIHEYIRWFWKNKLESHFQQEEKEILPLLKPHSLKSKKLIQQHQEIRAFFNRISMTTEDIIELEKCLNNHIRFEERELFGHLQNSLSNSDLEKISWNKNTSKSCDLFKVSWD